ncbi:MAG: response regulator [Candidatus Omnitrophica bacterium]|nr:response regulator [Candidatus Omnitrophota bacterium]MDD5355892.1 response regulator [Candidatus Omnitrophota bacterium]
MPKKKILICDDEIGIRESLNLILKDNYDISFCNNGQECLGLLKSGQEYDLILLDIKMPKLSGLDTLREIKKEKPGMKAIIITGYRSVETAAEAINAGASDYIVKPFNSKDIIKSVEKSIG